MNKAKRPEIGNIVSVTGTPGVGKTTFAKRLSELIPYKYVDLNETLIEGGCVMGRDEERGSLIIDLERGEALVSEMFAIGNYLLDSHLSHLVVPSETLNICLVLRCSPYVMKKRLSENEIEKSRENWGAEILGIILSEAVGRYGAERICEVDVSESLDAALEEAIEAIRERKAKPIGRIDWLTEVVDKGDLSFFFD